MSAIETFEAQKRVQTGSGAATAVRNQGMVPAVVYGDNKDPESIAVSEKEILRCLQQPNLFSNVYTLKTGKSSAKVVVRDVQLHPVSDRPLHVDFMRVNDKKDVSVFVPVIYQNHDKCTGIKRGGTLNVISRSLEIRCKPAAIPTEFVVDLSGLPGSHSIKLDSLSMPEGVVAGNPVRDAILATISSARGAKKGAEAEAAE